MARVLPPTVLFCCLLLPASAGWSQFGTPMEFQLRGAESPRESERTQGWKVGIEVEAALGPCFGIYGTFSVPTQWPEQDVKIIDERISDTIRQSSYRETGDGVRQMRIVVPRLEAGEKAEAVLTFEVTRRTAPPPSDTSIYRIPEDMPLDVRKCLGSSPYIDCRNAKIRSTAKQLTVDKETAWEKAQAIHDWVRDTVEHTNEALKGSLETLRAKKGNHEDLAGLFIALCRASKIPARIVWVPGYCYAEFYLESESGQENEDGEMTGQWFPCEFKEKTVFGTVSSPYIILQKGDNVRVPEVKEPQRFVPEHLKVKSGQKPKVSFIREVAAAK